MDIKNYFSFESEPIPAEDVFSLTESVLDDLYKNSSEIEQLNIFFHLQNEYIFLKNAEKKTEAAYLCYLISYYVFTPLTPPHSETIALEFAKEAISIDSTEKYIRWLNIVKKGN